MTITRRDLLLSAVAGARVLSDRLRSASRLFAGGQGRTGDLLTLPADLPVPIDDGACRHLPTMRMPALRLLSTAGRWVDVQGSAERRTVIYCYPRTGQPDKDPGPGWDQIPGARGCTPETCAFRDHHKEIARLGADVYGVSTQDSSYQQEMVRRLNVPFEVLSDADLKLVTALRLPTFEFEGLTLIRRLTMIVRNRRIEKIFYPVFPPDQHAAEIVSLLKEHGQRI
jgi:peroxiredoxin